MSEHSEQGATGVDETGASGTEQQAAEPVKSINSQAKELPWVKELMQSKAELDQLKEAQAEAQRRAEQEKAESEGNYAKALEMEQSKYKELEIKYTKEMREMQLTNEFVSAGFRKEAFKLLGDQYNPDDDGSPSDFVAKMKESEENSWLFIDQQQSRQRKDPPPASGVGSGSNYDPSWIRSDDPKKREIAIQKNREAIFADLRKSGKLPPR